MWMCLTATKVASLLRKQPNFSLQNRYLRLTTMKEIVIEKGRETIIKSIEHSTIKNPMGDPI